MYTGVINAEIKEVSAPSREKIQFLEAETIECNGAISINYKFKTREIKTDRTIKYRDFDILNLQAINAVGQLKPVNLTPSNDMVNQAAAQANQYLNDLQIIMDYEQSKTQAETK